MTHKHLSPVGPRLLLTGITAAMPVADFQICLRTLRFSWL